MSEGTAIFVIGLFIVALGFSIGAFVTRKYIIAIIAGFLWAILGASRIVERSWSMDYILSTFCFIVTIIMIMMPMIYRDKKQEQENVDISKKDRLRARMENIRNFRKGI